LNPKNQNNPYQSPWPIWIPLILFIWKITWFILCSWTPKFFNPWRLLVLKAFGAKISGLPFVYSSANIQIPWNLTMKHRACLGERANAYSLGRIEISQGATVAQEAYLCSGSHDFSDPALQLIVKKITIEAHAFIGARAMIMPGVKVGKNTVVGAMSVVTKNVHADQIVAGNPAKEIGIRNN
jgi:putative colanic acid biosynthesis acetyltransferase WcaF